MTEIRRWAEMSGPEISRLAALDPVAILPVAAVEQHGPHLPLETDVVIGKALVEAAVAALAAADGNGPPTVVLPTLKIGASLEHSGFAGTLSLPAEALIEQIYKVGAALASAGVRRLVLFNSHGGNKAAIDIAALKLRADYALLVVKASYFRFAVPAGALSAEELAHGLHGGALETSIMLHLKPEAVRRDQLADNRSLGARRAEDGLTLGPEGDAGFAWRAEDLHPSGATGNAASADSDAGRQLVAAFSKRLAEIIAEAAAFDRSIFDRRR